MGQKCSEEKKEKLRISMSGKGNPFYSRKHSEETKKKISEERKKLGIKGGNPVMYGEDNPSKRPEVRRKIAETKLGQKNPNWKGGISTENALIRHSSKYKQWRQDVFMRDGYTCQVCGAKNGDGKNVTLNADHIKPFAYHPELRFDLSNGKTLCVDCHKNTETYGFHK